MSEALERTAAEWAARVGVVEVLIAPGYVITSAEEYQVATEVLLEVKAMFKELEENRQAFTRPLLDAKSAVDAQFKPALNKLLIMEANLKSMVSRFTLAQQAEQRRLAALVAETAPTKEAFTAGMQVAAEAAVPKVAGISTRERWVAVLVNEALVPRELLSPDQRKAQAAVDAGARTLPGYEVVRDVSVTVRPGA